ncbi:MAG: hypothetical protein IPI29_06570 [Ignavibacteria bacterium]|nr:hypothetical protein [Ignavibacteria bacterium]
MNNLLPTQTGNAGRTLVTDGTNTSWQTAGTLSGNGSAQQIAWWRTPTSLGGNSNLFYDTTNARVGISNPAPAYPLSFTNLIGPKISLWRDDVSGSTYGFSMAGSTLQIHAGFNYDDISFGNMHNGTYSEVARMNNEAASFVPRFQLMKDATPVASPFEQHLELFSINTSNAQNMNRIRFSSIEPILGLHRLPCVLHEWKREYVFESLNNGGATLHASGGLILNAYTPGGWLTNNSTRSDLL